MPSLRILCGGKEGAGSNGPALLPGRCAGSDGVQDFSAVDERVLRLQEIGETVELLETRIGVMLAVRSVTWHLDRDDVRPARHECG